MAMKYPGYANWIKVLADSQNVYLMITAAVAIALLWLVYARMAGGRWLKLATVSLPILFAVSFLVMLAIGNHT